MRFFVVALVLYCTLSALPETSSAQRYPIDSSRIGTIFSIDCSILIYTTIASDGYPVDGRSTTHVIRDSYKVPYLPNDLGVYRWVDSNTIYASQPAFVGDVFMGFGLTLTVDWKNSRVKSLTIKGMAQGGFEAECSISVDDFPMWTDGENIIIDVPQSLFNNRTISFYRKDLGTDKYGTTRAFESLSSVESLASHLHIEVGRESVLHVPQSMSRDANFQVMNNVQGHSAIARFSPSNVIRTLQLYNMLGHCMKEISIQPNSTSEEIAISFLPTGHYTACLGNEVRAFAVWR